MERKEKAEAQAQNEEPFLNICKRWDASKDIDSPMHDLAVLHTFSFISQPKESLELALLKSGLQIFTK